MDRHEETPLQSSVEAQNSEKSGHSEESEVSMVKKKAQFSGSCSFLVSLLGYSMGTSDFWRFPYLVFRNGGGKNHIMNRNDSV
jgi:hypothetical protein